MNMKLLEASGKIDGIKTKLSSKEKEFYSVTIDKLVYNVFDYFPSFKQLETKEIRIGNKVEVFFAESNYEYKGKPTMSRHLKRFVKVDIDKEVKKPTQKIEIERVGVMKKPKPKEKMVKAGVVELIKKDLLGATSLQQLHIIRQSSLRSAIEACRNCDDVTDEKILESAEKYGKWVLR